jgi:ABC-type transporter Mla subunit MlaD
MTFFDVLSDAAILFACVAAAAGCFALNRRVRRLASTELGIGKAVSEMSRSVSQFEALLAAAEESTREASQILDEQLAQARKLVARLEAIAGVVPRAAATTSQTSRKSTVSNDPLSDVVPKGAVLAEAAGKGASEIGKSSAQGRLAELALQRHAMNSSSAAGPGRRALA